MQRGVCAECALRGNDSPGQSDAATAERRRLARFVVGCVRYFFANGRGALLGRRQRTNPTSDLAEERTDTSHTSSRYGPLH